VAELILQSVKQFVQRTLSLFFSSKKKVPSMATEG